MNILQKNRNRSPKEGAQHLRARKSAQHLRYSQRAQRGQVLIIVVFAIVGLVAFVGLVVDTGLVFIGNGKLRRAVDAAALAAAAEYRKDPTTTELSKAAKEFLTLNDISQATADVHLICDPTDSMYDNRQTAEGQCYPANRRLVYVYATSTINLAFLPVIGIRTVVLSASATSEAASLDIVLLMDVSESMTWKYVNSAHESTDILADPVECNKTLVLGDYTQCQPFSDIQHAAVQFVNDRFPDDGSNQFDRVSIIPFDRKAHTDIADAYDAPLHLGVNSDNHLTSAQYKQKIVDTIKGLRVYTASGTVATGGPLSDGSCLKTTGDFPSGAAPCRSYPYDGDGYCLTSDDKPLSQEDTPPTDATLADLTCFTPDPTGPYSSLDGTQHYQRAYNLFSCPDGIAAAHCGTTDTGDAFRAAGEEFVLTPGFRQQSLWIVIMLTDGVANHSQGDANCPFSDGATCQDNIVATVSNGATGRHCLTNTDPLYTNVGSGILFNACHSATPNGGGGTVDVSAYDADDYARDMADFVALGQNALIYTIGFGDAVTNPNNSGQQLLNYAADIGDDALVNTPAGQLNSDYFFAPNAAALQGIFTTINDRIATRITQ